MIVVVINNGTIQEVFSDQEEEVCILDYYNPQSLKQKSIEVSFEPSRKFETMETLTKKTYEYELNKHKES